MGLLLLIGLLLVCVLITDGLVFPLHLLHLPHLPLWLSAAIALTLLSWFLDD
jgi:hypothetical protein